MRRVIVALLFPLLLAAQQGAFVHSIEHFAINAAAAGKADTKQSPPEGFCEKCFAHAAVGSAVNASPATLAVLATTTERIASLPAAAQAADVRNPRSRGPPLFL
jgi:hypothetical protein